MKLILVRHGETAWNKENRVQGLADIELNETGRRQIERLAQDLKDEKIEVIYSSPIRRACESACIIGRFHRVDIVLEDGLSEMNPGDFEGLTFHELKNKFEPFLQQWLKDPASVKMPGGESLQEIQARAWQVIDRIMQKAKNALIVSHNFTLAAVICKMNNISLSQFRSVSVALASKTVFDIFAGSTRMELWNGRHHLHDLEN